jgi:ABC-2 type transport system ATP-binding protein
LLFLDEPTTGLDPQSRRALWDLIREMRGRGATVFLTTQYLAEADDLSDRVAVVHDGRIAAVGTPGELKDRFGTTAVRLKFSGDSAAEAVRQATGLEPVPAGENGWVVLEVPGGDAAVPALIGRLSASGPVIERLAVVPPTLEDVFVSLTGSELESGVGGTDGSLSAVRRGMGVTAGGRS